MLHDLLQFDARKGDMQAVHALQTNTHSDCFKLLNIIQFHLMKIPVFFHIAVSNKWLHLLHVILSFPLSYLQYLSKLS